MELSNMEPRLWAIKSDFTAHDIVVERVRDLLSIMQYYWELYKGAAEWSVEDRSRYKTIEMDVIRMLELNQVPEIHESVQ